MADDATLLRDHVTLQYRSIEYPCPLDHFDPVRVSVPASASSQVARESIECLCIHARNGQAVSTGPVDEVLRRSEMFATGNRSVSQIRQRVREAFQQCAGGPLAKRTDTPPCLKEV